MNHNSDTTPDDDALRASEERYRQLADLGGDTILINLNNHFVYASQAAVTLFGASSIDDVLGTSPFDWVDQEFCELLKQRIDTILKHKTKVPLQDMRWRRMDGSTMYVQSTANYVLWDGQPAIQVMLRDISELKLAQNKLHVMNQRLKLAVERTGESIWDWDIVNSRFRFSGGLKATLGSIGDEAYGSESDWHKAIHPDDLERVTSAFRAALEGKVPVYESEYRLRGRDGHWKWVRARGVIVERDDQQNPLMMTGTLTDITARKESDELIWRHANLDPLTNLPNRRLFRERLDFELLKAKRTGHHLALLFIDLDGFKQINDFSGHDAGDLLLMEAAQRIKRCVRETDTVARVGGDEFTVTLSSLEDTSHIELVCQKILTSLAQTFHISNKPAYVSGSIGVSVYPMDGNTAAELLRTADQAMYAAKKQGKNQFSYFTQEMDEKAHLRLRLMNELRNALNAQQLAVHYQPVVDLPRRRIVKAEALLRWQHPELGNVSPSVFIPLAEESGLIGKIGNWVFQQAAACSKRWSEHIGDPFQISINKSPVQFTPSDLESNWLQHLADLGLPGSSISIEITEGMLLDASSTIAHKLIEYRDAGIQVAIDDFGTGYSSMAYLQKFHIDYLKIDQSFVRNITTDLSSRTIAETIILMAHKLGLKVIAEGIETKEQLECLMAAGCDYGQGYLFSRPVPAHELENMLSAVKI